MLTPIRRLLSYATKWLLRRPQGDKSQEPPKTDAFAIASDYLRQLRGLARSSPEQQRGSGWFDILVVFFLWKQIDHVDAILRLGAHRDGALVARSMIEGLCQLKWAEQDPDARADRWRRFAWIHDWRLLRKRTREGHIIPADTRKRIEDGVEEFCGDFRKRKKARPSTGVKPARPDPGPDPYVRHWSGMTVADLCREVGGTPLYEWPYAQFSDWHHWSPGGFHSAIEWQDRRVGYTPPQLAEVVPVYLVAFQCFYETLNLANNRFKLGLDAQLAAIYKRYLGDRDALLRS